MNKDLNSSPCLNRCFPLRNGCGCLNTVSNLFRPSVSRVFDKHKLRKRQSSHRVFACRDCNSSRVCSEMALAIRVGWIFCELCGVPFSEIMTLPCVGPGSSGSDVELQTSVDTAGSNRY